MIEILLSLHPQYWELIKSGAKTEEIRKTMPLQIPASAYPFRVIVYLTGGIGVVGKFECDKIRRSNWVDSFVKGSCLTGHELYAYAAGKPLFGWHIKENSVVEYETPFPLERATGLKHPPQSWRYLRKDPHEKE